MNLIEAIKSGKPIRRPNSRAGRDGWDWIDAGTLLEMFGSGDLRPWTKEDLLADDWEIQEPIVMITRSQFWKSYAEALKIAKFHYRPLTTGKDPISAYETGHDPISELARKLGLEDK